MSEDIKHHHQRAVPISSSRGCLRETNHMRSMRQTVATPLPSSSLALRGQDEAPTRACLGADSEELLVTTTHRRRRRRRPQDEDLQVVAGTKLNHKSSNIRPPVTETGRHRHCRRHSTHTNWAHMIGPMLYLVLIILNQSVSIYCKPNTSSQQQHNNNHLQQQLQLTDKQLLRKALDSSESSRAQAIGSAITSQSSSSAGGNGGGESLSSTASATTTTTSSTATTLAANGGGNGVRSSASSQNQNQNQGQDGAGNGQFQCPEQFGYYTDTRDCTKYYVCVFGEVLHESCTGGLRFSRELQTCDWPRNVECPNNQTSTTNSESSSSTTASTSALSPSSSSSSPSTTTAATTTTSSTSTSGYSSSTPQPTTTLPGTTSAATTTSTNSPNGIQDNRSKSVNGGNSASLVFADENSDPQQPSFDEAISPVITADGAIHLHDGSGGTFALGPNPNRGIASSAPQSINGPVESGSGGQSSQAERNVDVFVMPLSLGSSSSQSSRGQTVNKQQRARFQQQPNNQNQQQPRLMLHSHNVHSNSPTTTNQQQRQQQQQQPPQHNLRPVPSELNSRNAAELSDESGDFNLNGPGASSSLASSGSEGSNSELEPDNNSSNNNNESDDDLSDQTDGPQSGGQSSPAPSNNGQADRDQADERNLQDNGAPGSLDGGSGASDVGPDQDQYGANNQNNDYNDQTSAGPGQQQPGSHVGNSYIPPVLAAASSSTNENFNSRLFQSGPSSTSTSIAPSSSPGLNNNNNNRQRQQSSALLSVNNRQIVDPSRQTFKPMLTPISSSNNRQQLANNQNTNQNQRSSIQQQQQQSSINANNRQNNQQQLQQLQNNNAQNNRQSRMSSQFAGNDSFNPSSLAPPNPLIASQPTQSSSSQSALTSSAASRFPTNDNSRQSFSNNNFNFNNDSSKLIRLPTSQQQQLFDNNNNNRNSPLTPSFQPRFPQQQQPQQQQPTRSQNTLLFSAQKPGFGFMSTPANPFAGSSAESTGANHTATNLYHDQSPGAGQRHPANEFHQTFAGPQQQQQQGQQQRRSRPPKRQQIPSGSSAPPPSSSSIPVAGRQRQTAGPLLDFDTTTTTSTTMSTPQLNQRERTTLSTAFNNDEQDTRRPPARPQSNFDQQQPPARLQLRPASVVVPPTTVNFRDSSTAFPVTNQPPQQPSRQRQTGGRTNSQLVAPLLDQQLANLRAPTAGSNGVDFNQSPGPTTIVGGSDNSGQLDTTDSLAPTAPTTTGSTSLASAGGSGVGSLDGATTAASQTAPGGGDPQAVANRYLNSAIDALEAGQPFGTVDYDFDILNDNSTDRRAPTPNQNQTAPQQQPQPQVQPARSSRPSSGRSRQQSGSNERSSDGSGQTASVGVGVQQQQPLATTTLAGGNQGGAQAAPTKKPRPTNKKITVNHEQALANIRASAEPAKRPEPLFQTPQPLQQASKCDNRACRLPDCKCGDTLAPGGMDPKVIPQVVLLTFDDAVNDLNWEIYEELFSGRTNPNGCPVLATFYVSHEWTDYGQVQTLYSRGHEMASHSVTHSFGEKFSKSQWFKEINGQREILNMYGGVKMNDVRGMRAPFLQIGGNKMFEMLYDANFTYDSSMPIFENSPPMWPYTLDYQLAHECMITPCPTKSFPGVWEVGMTMWVDLRGGRCSMGDACSNPSDEDGVYEMLMKNFNRHYKSNRAPFGLFYHSAWFNTVHHRRGFLRFMSTVNSLPDVFFVTNWQMLQWMRQPTPISEINSFEPWQCPAKNDRPPPCYHPSVCNVKSEHGTRFMKTCQPCPANQQYPWVGATGFKQSKQNGSG